MNLREPSETVVLRPRLRAYVAGSLVGSGGAVLPYVAPDLVVPWQANPTTLALWAFGALAAHVVLHVACARPEGTWARFVAARLIPGATVGLAALVVYAFVPAMRASAWAALVANAAASSLEVWEAGVLVRERPARVRAQGQALEISRRREIAK